ncbi:hypothetical protein [Acetobacter oeni]|uniref:Uncharacterized protein n=1 Tax=Acetobacter oeni TaxID=304077 RepID=A0A511XG69_9PROT|nr:hypothetical protein [Acetobacter oeni]MBB3882133.1 hypothetical protein [Acetobacter oeni]NHO17896.1 hypothetical protein [Acetobacter oeni]GBR01559.1 hypothetical protein AA21952_0464 [Acetobacter oeni LMG 21952]GEN61944.1 hypothetical protein AOE01nite_01680 [Acetobacter oeni]
MRKETAFVIAFLVFTIGTASVIWLFALPNFVAVSFPHVTGGKIAVGPMRHERVLTQQEIATLNDWLQHHQSGWGPLSTTPPSSGDARMELTAEKDGKPDPIVLTLWTGISAADWNRTVFVETPDGSKVRTETFRGKEFDALRLMVDEHSYQHSAFP